LALTFRRTPRLLPKRAQPSAYQSAKFRQQRKPHRRRNFRPFRKPRHKHNHN
jgi:hypothetical protein